MTQRKRVSARSLVQAAVLLVVGASLGAVLVSQVRPVAAGSVQHFSLLAATMQTLDSTIGHDSEDGLLRTVQESTSHTVTAYRGQVDLPDGARVVGVRAFGLDTDPFFEFCYDLCRYNLDSEPVYEAVTDWVCSGESFQDGDIVLNAPVHSGVAVVDSEHYSYAIFLVLPTPYNPPYQDLAVLRFVVDSTYQVGLPLVPLGW
jgi:hypothetical protein